MTVTMFTDVFHTAIDAILQSYLTDVEANDGRPVFVDAHTQKFIETHGKLEVPGSLFTFTIVKFIYGM